MAQLESVIWEDPPPRKNTPRPYAGYNIGARTSISGLLEQLKQNPGVWGLVHLGGGEGTTARRLKFEAAGCETRTIKTVNEPRKLYARFLP